MAFYFRKKQWIIILVHIYSKGVEASDLTSFLQNTNNIHGVHCARLPDFSQYVVPRGGIFLGKCRSCFAGDSDE
jgi:hypothetical protein